MDNEQMTNRQTPTEVEVRCKQPDNPRIVFAPRIVVKLNDQGYRQNVTYEAPKSCR